MTLGNLLRVLNPGGSLYVFNQTTIPSMSFCAIAEAVSFDTPWERAWNVSFLKEPYREDCALTGHRFLGVDPAPKCRFPFQKAAILGAIWTVSQGGESVSAG